MSTYYDHQEIFETANQALPESGYFGTLTEMYGEASGFHWVPNAEKFYELLRLLIYLARFDQEPLPEELEFMNALVDDLQNEKIDAIEFCDRFNAGNIGGTSLLWCGSFEDLLVSDQEGANRIRGSFWESLDDEKRSEKCSPILASKIKQFTEFIGEWV